MRLCVSWWPSHWLPGDQFAWDIHLGGSWDEVFWHLKFQTDFYIEAASSSFHSSLPFFAIMLPNPLITTLDNIMAWFDFVMDTCRIILSPMSILYDSHFVSRDTTWRRRSFYSIIFRLLLETCSWIQAAKYLWKKFRARQSTVKQSMSSQKPHMTLTGENTYSKPICPKF